MRLSTIASLTPRSPLLTSKIHQGPHNYWHKPPSVMCWGHTHFLKCCQSGTLSLTKCRFAMINKVAHVTYFIACFRRRYSSLGCQGRKSWNVSKCTSMLYACYACSKDVRLPVNLQRAMAAEAESTREAKAKVRQNCTVHWSYKINLILCIIISLG